MRRFHFEHLMAVTPFALELCPRCKTGHIMRTQPETGSCPHGGCVDPADLGIVYVRLQTVLDVLELAAHGSYRAIEHAQLQLLAAVQHALPHRPDPDPRKFSTPDGVQPTGREVITMAKKKPVKKGKKKLKAASSRKKAATAAPEAPQAY